MNKEQEQKQLEITKEDIQAVKGYLDIELAADDIRSFDFEVTRDEDKNEVVLTQQIDKQRLGIFRHALTKCTLLVKIYPGYETDTGRKYHRVFTKIQYYDIGGGSNGCDLDIKLHVLDGRVYEVEQ